MFGRAQDPQITPRRNKNRTAQFRDEATPKVGSLKIGLHDIDLLFTDQAPKLQAGSKGLKLVHAPKREYVHRDREKPADFRSDAKGRDRTPHQLRGHELDQFNQVTFSAAETHEVVDQKQNVDRARESRGPPPYKRGS